MTRISIDLYLYLIDFFSYDYVINYLIHTHIAKYYYFYSIQIFQLMNIFLIKILVLFQTVHLVEISNLSV